MNTRPSLLEHVDAHVCGWCRGPLADPRARYCCQRCRQTAWRARRELSLVEAGDRPLRLLGSRRGDSLVDLYPGTGIVGRVWAAVSAEVDRG